MSFPDFGGKAKCQRLSKRVYIDVFGNDKAILFNLKIWMIFVLYMNTRIGR